MQIPPDMFVPRSRQWYRSRSFLGTIADLLTRLFGCWVGVLSMKYLKFVAKNYNSLTHLLDHSLTLLRTHLVTPIMGHWGVTVEAQ